ncbi:MAG: YkgJ family cysteine cluster protein [Candidatus Woesearchaeota archaeon]
MHKLTPLKEVIELAHCEKNCPKCDYACMHGSGVLAPGDKERIASFLGISTKELEEKFLEPITKFNTTRERPKLLRKDKPYGQCIFYSPQKGCTIHPVKPLECRIATCHPIGEQTSIWFNVNFFVNKEDPQSIREFKQYLEAGGKTIEGAKLEDFVPDKNKLKIILDGR